MHSTAPRADAADEPPRVRVGGPDCTQPYDMALLNVSAMSFGALSANALRALNARRGDGRLRPRHRRGRPLRTTTSSGGDLVWEIGSGYFGARTKDGGFDPAEFADKAAHDARQVRVAQAQPGREAGHRRRAARRPRSPRRSPQCARRAAGREVRQPRRAHGVLAPRASWCAFIARMRELAGGKPAGFKLCVGAARECSPSARRCSTRARRPTSSSSTAPRAAPARRRWSTPTTSARRSPRA